jgi:hypothetical protein
MKSYGRDRARLQCHFQAREKKLPTAGVKRHRDGGEKFHGGERRAQTLKA